MFACKTWIFFVLMVWLIDFGNLFNNSIKDWILIEMICHQKKNNLRQDVRFQISQRVHIRCRYTILEHLFFRDFSSPSPFSYSPRLSVSLSLPSLSLSLPLSLTVYLSIFLYIYTSLSSLPPSFFLSLSLFLSLSPSLF